MNPSLSLSCSLVLSLYILLSRSFFSLYLCFPISPPFPLNLSCYFHSISLAFSLFPFLCLSLSQSLIMLSLSFSLFIFLFLSSSILFSLSLSPSLFHCDRHPISLGFFFLFFCLSAFLSVNLYVFISFCFTLSFFVFFIFFPRYHYLFLSFS